MPNRPTAIIADDHHIVRAGLKLALETPGLAALDGIEVLGEAGDGLEAIDLAKRLRPDLAVLDVSMPRASGVEVIIEIRRWVSEIKIVVFTGVSAPGLVSALVAAGVDGLFSKAGASEALYAKLPLILNGGRHVDPFFVEILEREPKPLDLTDRERQVLNMIARGKSNREIGEDLGISAKTVDKHRTSLMSKLGVHSLAQLLARALKDGLIDPAQEL